MSYNSSSSSLFEAFEDEYFVTDEYAQKQFQSFPEDRIVQHLSDLEGLKDYAAGQLQLNVYDNYQKFIATTKQISHMESDMLSLRNLLSEENTVLKSLMDASLDFETNSTQGDNDHVSRITLDAEKVAQIRELVLIPDQLDVCIAERRYGKAVDILEKVKGRLVIQDLPQLSASLKETIQQKVDLLSTKMASDLQNPNAKNSETKSLIGFLVRLNQGEKARDVFLQTRSRALKRQIRKLRFEGDIKVYIGLLSGVVFANLNTVNEEYEAAFQDPKYKSGFIMWAIAELDTFGSLFKRQVFNTDDFLSMAECIEIAKGSCQVLQEKGMSFSFYLDEMFLPDMISAISQYYSRMEASLFDRINDEVWQARDFNVGAQSGDQIVTVKLTESGKHLYKLLHEFMSNVNRVLNYELYTVVIIALARLLESFLDKMVEAATNDDMMRCTDKQKMSIISNVVSVTKDLLPRVTRQFQRRFERPINELEHLIRKTENLEEDLLSDFMTKRGQQLVNEQLKWDDSVFSDESEDGLDDMVPAKRFQEMMKFLFKMQLSLSDNLGMGSVIPSMQMMIEEISTMMAMSGYWETQPSIGKRGLVQLVLDMKFVVGSAGVYASSLARKAVDRVMKNAAECFASSHPGVSIGSVLPNEEWFNSRIQSMIEKLNLQPLKDLIHTLEEIQPDAEFVQENQEAGKQTQPQTVEIGSGIGRSSSSSSSSGSVTGSSNRGRSESSSSSTRVPNKPRRKPPRRG